MSDTVIQVDEDSVFLLELTEEEQFTFRRFVEIAIREGKPCIDGGLAVPDFRLRDLREDLERLGIIEERPCVEVSPSEIYLTGATLEVTPFCPFRCAHCLLPESYRSRQVIMPLDMALRVIREVSEVGGWAFSITGGEPTLTPGGYLGKISSLVRDVGGELLINTNCLNYHVFKHIDKEVSTIKVSLYGHDKRSYTLFTKFNAFNAVKRCLDFLKINNFRFSVNIIYTRTHEVFSIDLSDIVEFASSYTDFITLTSHIHPGWDPNRKVNYLSLPQPKGWKDRPLVTFQREIRWFPSLMDPCAVAHAPNPFIRHDGYVYTCPFFPEVVAHLDNRRWRELYYLKMTYGSGLPWKGGRCGLLR